MDLISGEGRWQFPHCSALQQASPRQEPQPCAAGMKSRRVRMEKLPGTPQAGDGDAAAASAGLRSGSSSLSHFLAHPGVKQGLW